MPKSTNIDWENFDKSVKTAGGRAAKKTDAILAAQLSQITSLTEREINELFPDQADVEKFAELMKIVKSSTSRNNKINKIVSNTEEFAGIVLSLLNKLV